MKKDIRECNNKLLRIKEENLDPAVVEEKKNKCVNNGKEERRRATLAKQISKCFGGD